MLFHCQWFFCFEKSNSTFRFAFANWYICNQELLLFPSTFVDFCLTYFCTYHFRYHYIQSPSTINKSPLILSHSIFFYYSLSESLLTLTNRFCSLNFVSEHFIALKIRIKEINLNEITFTVLDMIKLYKWTTFDHFSWFFIHDSIHFSNVYVLCTVHTAYGIRYTNLSVHRRPYFCLYIRIALCCWFVRFILETNLWYKFTSFVVLST